MLDQQLAREIVFTPSSDPEHPWTADMDGQRWQVRLNDFPDEVLYSLIIDGRVIGDFNDWPSSWRRGE